MSIRKQRIIIFCPDQKLLEMVTGQFDHSRHIVASAATKRELITVLEVDRFDSVIVLDSPGTDYIPRIFPDIKALCPEAALIAAREKASRSTLLESINTGCSFFIEGNMDNIGEITEKIISRRRSGSSSISYPFVFRPDSSLTNRETEILYELLTGKNNREIGETLDIQEKTVKNHLWKIYRKYGVRNRTQLFGKLISGCPYFRLVAEYKEEKRPVGKESETELQLEF